MQPSSTETMNALSMSLSQCRDTYRDEKGRPYDKIVIGALIFEKASPVTPKLLLLKRAEHEEHYPNIFEIPGGKVEDEDLTIRDAVKREVMEETGLQVEEISAATTPFSYTIERKVPGDESGLERVLRTSLQFNFVCDVTGYDFKVDPDEHSEGRFAARAELAELNMTEQMREVAEEAFAKIA